MYDVIIIGAGPAGSTLARLIGKDRSVLLVESRRMGFPGRQSPSHEKCCGGLLAPDARKWLLSHGLEIPETVLDSTQPLSVRAIDASSGLIRDYPRTYVNLCRSSFEQWLLSLLPPTVSRLDGHRCVAVKRKVDGRWEVRLRGPNGTVCHSARCLVGADGANSIVRHTGDQRIPADTVYVAVQDTFPRLSSATEIPYAAFFHPAMTDFYGWLIPKRDRILCGLALPYRVCSVSERMEMLHQIATRSGYQLEGEYRRQGCLLLRPRPGDICYGADGSFCIGEAAGWISPSSAEGFSYAFASAEALASALNRHETPQAILRAYRNGTASLRLNLAWKRLKMKVMFTPSLRRAVMKSGLASVYRRDMPSAERLALDGSNTVMQERR